jgi:hypothetical protein
LFDRHHEENGNGTTLEKTKTLIRPTTPMTADVALHVFRISSFSETAQFADHPEAVPSLPNQHSWPGLSKSRTLQFKLATSISYGGTADPKFFHDLHYFHTRVQIHPYRDIPCLDPRVPFANMPGIFYVPPRARRRV